MTGYHFVVPSAQPDDRFEPQYRPPTETGFHFWLRFDGNFFLDVRWTDRQNAAVEKGVAFMSRVVAELVPFIIARWSVEGLTVEWAGVHMNSSTMVVRWSSEGGDDAGVWMNSRRLLTEDLWQFLRTACAVVAVSEQVVTAEPWMRSAVGVVEW